MCVEKHKPSYQLLIQTVRKQGMTDCFRGSRRIPKCVEDEIVEPLPVERLRLQAVEATRKSRGQSADFSVNWFGQVRTYLGAVIRVIPGLSRDAEADRSRVRFARPNRRG